MSNHLQNETSPYLLQHVDNPVNWYPWGDKAFERAAREDKPIFLSIGYSTCHWCHVMAHESFENEEIAAILNEHFISIKVDREERPDIDSVYMAVCQAITGGGGWPTSIFLTAEQKPFFAGTYFPPSARYGIISFPELLQTVAEKWGQNRPELLRSADKIIAHLKKKETGAADINPALPEAAAKLFAGGFDEECGGFGEAPKFPSPHNLLFLMLYSQIRSDPHSLKMAETTLSQMRRGGIFDHIGFGFSRYSTDRFFLAPHFEKMLYDNSLLLLTYTVAYSITKNSLYLDTAEKIAAYVRREMTASEGGFYSAQDADSDGVEGKYYLFGYDEIISVLGEDTGRKFNEFYGITQKGNFEGFNIPNRLHCTQGNGALDEALPILYEYRKKREKLHLDDKILTSWNALMITALTTLYRVTDKSEYLAMAQRAQEFIEKKLSKGEQLYGSYRDEKHSGKGFLDDYAFYTAALIGLYEATGEKPYLVRADGICREAVNQFGDDGSCGFYLSGKENERLVLASKETYDGAMPSGNSVMAYAMVRLSQLTHDVKWEQEAEKQLAFLSGEAEKYPAGHCMFLFSMLMHMEPPQKITVVLSAASEWEDIKKQLPLYADVTVMQVPTKEFALKNGQITYYICKGKSCQPPTNEL